MTFPLQSEQSSSREHNKIHLYFMAAAISLSSAGSLMTVVALSADLSKSVGISQWSGLIETCSYLGAAVVGFLGGYLLQKHSFVRIGVWTSFLGIPITLFLWALSEIKPAIGLPCVFTIFCLTGLELPNTVSFFSHLLKEQERIRFFSLMQSMTMAATFVAPSLAGMISSAFSTRWCYLFDALTFFILLSSWIFFRSRYRDVPSKRNDSQQLDWFLGFRVLVQNKLMFRLTMARVLYCFAYAPFMACLPIWVTHLTGVVGGSYAESFGFANSLKTFGFFSFSLIGVTGMIRDKNLHLISWLAAFLPIVAIALGESTDTLVVFFIGCLLFGVGNYFFRILIVTLGQKYTPKEVLGPTIVAGDALVRLSAAVISAVAVSTTLIVPTPYGYVLLGMSLVALFAPAVILRDLKSSYQRTFGSVSSVTIPNPGSGEGLNIIPSSNLIR
jgi:MFS family permease